MPVLTVECLRWPLNTCPPSYSSSHAPSDYRARGTTRARRRVGQKGPIGPETDAHVTPRLPGTASGVPCPHLPRLAEKGPP
ncbi:hypothetical protein ROHU_000150 [Labeo rohita]|uniref:Uncharacterized protein n=1 Tax=Labeo rohita TaxID=84645 RepID=A0A498M730_LABRO|nr:hypothetical protein ROHU_028376 [Labeo rohita]RXN39469.1 hypothetical protein ROHU_000150 [Labeo rohita]